MPRSGAIRFELHDGDQAPWDADNNHASERIEIADRQPITYGTPLQVSYDFMLEPGQPNTAYFMVLGQLHQNVHEGALVVPPPFSITLTGEKMGISIGSSDANGNPVQQVIFTDAYDIQRGHNYDMDIKATFDPDGNGRLVVTRDGVTIVDYMGPLGYIQDQGSTGPKASIAIPTRRNPLQPSTAIWISRLAPQLTFPIRTPISEPLPSW